MNLLSRVMLLAAVALLASCSVLAVVLAVQGLPPQWQDPVGALLIVCLLALIVRRRGLRLFTSGGTAVWAKKRELEKAGMLQARTGLILGRIPFEGSPLGQAVKALLNPRLGARDACREFFDCLKRRRRKQGHLVRLPQAVHTSVYVPTGGGKGVSCIVPFLKTCEEACVIVDGKNGELARLTAATRKRMGHDVILLDPSRCVTPTPGTLNILDFINRNSPRAVQEACAVGNALVTRTGDEKEPHWLDRSEAWLSALTATTVWYGRTEKGTRSLLNVAEMVSNPGALKTALALMQASPELWNGSLVRMGGMLSHSVGEELSSTLSTVGRFISFMNDPAVAESLQASSFDLSKLRKGKTDIYLIQRAEDTRTGAPLLRLWLNACIRELMKGGLNPKRNVHVVVDEAGAVGRLDCLSDVLNVGRGFGLKLQLYYQDVGQLKRCWENPQGVLANTTQIFFGVNDKDTAEYVSARLGNETIVVDSGGSNNSFSRNRGSSSGSSYSESSGHSYSTGSSSNWQQQSRELLKASEITALDPRIAITLTPGLRPLWTRLVRYYEEPALFKRRGWLRGLATAVWTLFLSATLLVLGIAAAAAITGKGRDILLQPQQQQRAPAANQPPPGFTPR